MKKLLALVFVLALCVALVGCGGDKTTSSTDNGESKPQSTASAPVKDTSSEAPVLAKWEQFIIDYEKWVDEYIVLSNKVMADPTNDELFDEYSVMLEEAVAWEEEMTEIETELKDDAAALAEFTAELERIAEKLLNAIEF